jgi:hypothetical protein
LEVCERLHELQRRYGKLLERHLRWSWRWKKELETGFYYELLSKGFIKPEDQEPNVVGFDFYFSAFSELSTTRQAGFGVGPIPFTAIVDYSRLFEIEDFEEFSYVIRRMDQVYLELNDQEKKAVDKGNSPNAKR